VDLLRPNNNIGIAGGISVYTPDAYNNSVGIQVFYRKDNISNGLYLGQWTTPFTLWDGSPHRLIINYNITGNTLTTNLSAIQYCNGLKAVTPNTSTTYTSITPVTYTKSFTVTDSSITSFKPRIVYSATQGLYNGTKDIGNIILNY
jgi:hypothetical protein